MCRLLGGLDLRTDWAEGHGFENSDPPFGQRLGGEVSSCSCGQLGAEFSGKAHACLRRLRRKLESTHHAADAERGVDIAEPKVQLFLLLGNERFLQLAGHFTSGLVARHHRIFRGGDNAAQIAQVEFFHVGDRSIGAIQPFSDAQLRQQLLGNSQQTGCRDLFLAFALQPLVLLGHREADCGDATKQRPFGDGAVFFR